MATRLVTGNDAKAWQRDAKWRELSPFLRKYGGRAVSYATLQDGIEYFIDEDLGYIAFTTVTHPVLARKPKRITLSDPVCATEDLGELIRRFLADGPGAAFVQVSEACAEVLRSMGYKVNCIGPEPELPIQTYNTRGNWKELDMIKRARNEARREGIVIREEQLENVNSGRLEAVSSKWRESKILKDREIWIYARRPVWQSEPDVRKFIAYDREGEIVGFVFYDPIYRDDRVVGYAANTLRCDETRYQRLATAIHMTAIDVFREEGKEVLNLCLAPFVRLDLGKFNDDRFAKLFFELSEKYGNDIYNFKGLAFHKSKYRARETPIYFASKSLLATNDIYLAFLSSGITESYFATMFSLLRGIVRRTLGKNSSKPRKPKTNESN